MRQYADTAVSRSKHGLTIAPATPTTQGAAGPSRLPRSLGLLNAISINMPNMVGTGPFITVPAIIATLGGPQSLLAWLVGALLPIAAGWEFGALGAPIPASGVSSIFRRDFS